MVDLNPARESVEVETKKKPAMAHKKHTFFSLLSR